MSQTPCKVHRCAARPFPHVLLHISQPPVNPKPSLTSSLPAHDAHTIQPSQHLCTAFRLCSSRPGSGPLGSHSILECPGQSLEGGTCSVNTDAKTSAHSVNPHSPNALETPVQRLSPLPDHMLCGPSEPTCRRDPSGHTLSLQTRQAALCPRRRPQQATCPVITYTWKLPDLSNS